jgi:hypothetical protein
MWDNKWDPANLDLDSRLFPLLKLSRCACIFFDIRTVYRRFLKYVLNMLFELLGPYPPILVRKARGFGLGLVVSLNRFLEATRSR